VGCCDELRSEGVSEIKSDVTWHEGSVSRSERWRQFGLHGCSIWLTGLSGSGKSSLCDAVSVELLKRKVPFSVLDGDNVRHGLSADLSLSESDRRENIRRLGEAALLLADAGLVVLVAAVSPFAVDRNKVRLRHETVGLQFHEVFVDAPIEVCESRDPKSIYARFRDGEISGLTGIDAPYEAPIDPELHLKTSELSVEESCRRIMDLIRQT